MKKSEKKDLELAIANLYKLAIEECHGDLSDVEDINEAYREVLRVLSKMKKN